jgi:hypothetical protein
VSNTQTQIQNQTQINQINSQVKVIEVPRRVYSVVRSVVESSTKPVYEWNKPIKVSENIVKFVKYKTLPNGLEVKAWEITVEPLVIQREGAELCATIVSVRDGCNRLVADLVIRMEFTAYEPGGTYTLIINNIEVKADSIHEYEYYFISPSDDVPYARPISLASLINKLMFFYNKAKGLTQNGDASEDDGI